MNKTCWLDERVLCFLSCWCSKGWRGEEIRIVNVEITQKSISITKWPEDAEDSRFGNNREAKSVFHYIHFNSGLPPDYNKQTDQNLASVLNLKETDHSFS